MRSRKNNTTLTRKVDKWNTRKVWLIKRYADGHYAINQEVGGRVFIPVSSGPPRRRSPRSSPAADSQVPRTSPGQDERSGHMTQNDLREKVINAEAKVAKRKAVLPLRARHQRARR